MKIVAFFNALACMAAENELFTLVSVAFWLLYFIGKAMLMTIGAEKGAKYDDDSWEAFCHANMTPKY